MSTESTKQKKCGKWDLKIINAGFPRCGTSSLSSALDILGFGPCWHLETNNPWFMDKHYRFFDNKLYAIKNGEYVDYDIFFEKTGIKCAMDAPFIAIWKELSLFYPKAKVIICIRDDYQRWKISLSNVTYWLINSKTLEFIGLYFSFIPIFRKEFCKILDDEWVKALDTKDKYNERIKEIKEFINDDKRLYIHNISNIKKNGWKGLCEFLEVPIPDTPYPLNNYKGKMMKRATNAMIKIITFVVIPLLLGTVVYYYMFN
eukprot:307603_1